MKNPTTKSLTNASKMDGQPAASFQVCANSTFSSFVQVSGGVARPLCGRYACKEQKTVPIAP